MKILVTGSAGFIGSFVAKRFLEQGDVVVGLDNLNTYYDVELKLSRLEQAGISSAEALQWNTPVVSSVFGDDYHFIRLDLEDKEGVIGLFEKEKFDLVIHLAAQAGVRYSVTNPDIYIKSNIEGFLNILEGCRHTNVKHLVYASSSSVYGKNGSVPFREKDSIAHPVSIYAATKKTNELMAHVYSHLFNLPTTGLRFFTVYGPWGRPDMSPHLFIDAIFNDRPIKVFNNGDLWRDFTYIDDIVEGVTRISKIIPVGEDDWDCMTADPSTSTVPYKIYNIGNSSPVRLMDYIRCMEGVIGKEAKKEFLPMQPSEVYKTYADSSALERVTGFRPLTPLQEGIERTVRWYKDYYKW